MKLPKTKNILVTSIVAVYIGLIGANAIWQYGDGVSGANLSAATTSCGSGYQPRTELLNIWRSAMGPEIASQCMNWMACESQDLAATWCENAYCTPRGQPCSNCTHECVSGGSNLGAMTHGLGCCQAAVDAGIVPSLRSDCGSMPSSPTSCGSGGGSGSGSGGGNGNGNGDSDNGQAERNRIKATQDTAANNAKRAFDAALARSATKVAASAAAAAVQEASATISEKAEKYQSQAEAALRCLKNPIACAPMPKIPPKYLEIANKIKQLKAHADLMIVVANKIQTTIVAKQKIIARIKAEVEFAQRFGLALSRKTIAAAETLQQAAHEDCVSTMRSLSASKSAVEASEEEPTEITTTEIDKTGQTTRIGVEDLDEDGMADAWEKENFGNLNKNGTTDTDSDGKSDLEEYTEGTDPNNPLGAEEAAEEAEEAEQEKIQEACAELDSPTNAVEAGGKNYAALLANLNNLSASLDITLARTEDAVEDTKNTATTAAAAASEKFEKDQKAKMANAVEAQKKANEAEADGTEENDPKPIAIGFLNKDSDGNPIIPEDDRDIIPITPIKIDDKIFAIPSWDYSPKYDD